MFKILRGNTLAVLKEEEGFYLLIKTNIFAYTVWLYSIVKSLKKNFKILYKQDNFTVKDKLLGELL